MTDTPTRIPGPRGPGRPRLYGERVDLSLRVDPALHAKLTRLAKRQGGSTNAFASDLLATALSHAKGS